MQGPNTIGINQAGIDKLILDIYNYAEKINKTLNQISDIVDQTKDFYICDEANNYRNKFNAFRTNFTIVNKNIISYADDLIKVKNKFEVMSYNNAQFVNNATTKIDYKIYEDGKNG